MCVLNLLMVTKLRKIKWAGYLVHKVETKMHITFL